MLTNQEIQEIDHLMSEGDKFLDRDDFSRALELYEKAISLLPEPKFANDVARSVFLAKGEALFFSGHISHALSAFQVAAKAPGGLESPLVHLRIGEAYFELGDLVFAADEFARAYMLDGEDIFSDVDKKYFEFLKTRMDIS